MLESKASQFTLSPEGQILWQEKHNNPMPGIEVARLVKGDHPLKPEICLSQNIAIADLDQIKAKDALSLWLNQYFSTVLEPLALLGLAGCSDNNLDDPVSQISKRVYDALGTVSREELETIIEKLDTEKRAILRNRKIRLGPILVFIPALNKPAAVRLRALLWNLYYDKTLPAVVPADGVVSQKIENTDGQELYFRSIGYPLYGGRAVRIDMLDRVISSIYDNAKDGVFEARHEMAEWLGTPIEDLYKILESLGYKKVEEIVAESRDVTINNETLKSEATSEVHSEISAIPKKNTLAKFRIKRGKVFQKREFKIHNNQIEKSTIKAEKNFKSKVFKNKNKNTNSKNKRDNDHIISFNSKKREDSPFAVLQQLIVKKDA